MAHGTGATAGARGPPGPRASPGARGPAGAASTSSAAASCAAPVASPADDPASAVKCGDGQEEERGCGQTSKAARRFHDPDDSNRHARRYALETSGSRRVDCARECQAWATTPLTGEVLVRRGRSSDRASDDSNPTSLHGFRSGRSPSLPRDNLPTG
jgi:hypothetical protein